MPLSNAEKQSRHRHYKKLAIQWYEAATGFSLKEVMDIMKFSDLPPHRQRELSKAPSGYIVDDVACHVCETVGLCRKSDSGKFWCRSCWNDYCRKT